MVPRVKAGKTVLICGHGNIIRSMLKRLDGIPNDVLKQVSELAMLVFCDVIFFVCVFSLFFSAQHVQD